MLYISKITQKGQVTIPAYIRYKWGIRPKEKVAFIEFEDKVVVKPAVDFFKLKGSIITKRKYSDKAADRAIGQYIAKQHAQKTGNY